MSNINFLSIQETHKLFKERQLTVKELVLSYLSRINRFDKCPNGLNSVLEINPDVIFIADIFDKKLKNGDELLPVFGIPILLKDNINTKDRLRTSAGSVALSDNYAPYDAHIVTLLRQAGAIILGKANMTEFANYMTRENMPSGYSSRGGQVKNPYDNKKSPSGSSSGSAVAVAAGLCSVSIGTETSGSILAPAGVNGIVGLKPTLGLVGRSGIIPISSTHDTAGPITRNVRDAALLLGVIAGVDPNDSATHVHNFFDTNDYLKNLGSADLKGVRIGINRSQKLDNFALNEEEKSIFNNLCQIISNAGAVLIDNVNIDSNFNIGKIMRNEFKTCINYYLSTLNGKTKMKSLKDIVDYNQANASIALKYGQSILLDTENNTSGTMTETEYIEALLERERTITELDKLFLDNNIDVMLCEVFTNIAPFTGFPSMTVPIGQQQDKIPIGSHWIARRYNESVLLKVIYAVEQLISVKIKLELKEMNI
ncbi:MAG: amidase [Clostridiales bacterium]|jgi:amidase|nr:amidase [Clostridiales bacterium]